MVAQKRKGKKDYPQQEFNFECKTMLSFPLGEEKKIVGEKLENDQFTR